MKITLRMCVAVLLSVCLLCNSVAFAENASTENLDDYIVSFEELLSERRRATMDGDSEKVAVLNQQLQRMGAEELTGFDVEAMVYGTPDVSPAFSVPASGAFQWTSTRLNTHYNGQQCEVMVVYIEPKVGVDSILKETGYIAEGGTEISYVLNSEAVPEALKLMSFAMDTYESISGIVTAEGALFTLADYLVNKSMEEYASIPKGSKFVYLLSNHTFLKLIFVKPLTASDESWELQLMASMTETYVNLTGQFEYDDPEEGFSLMQIGEEYTVIHRAHYYAYQISDAVRDYCTGVAPRYSYVTEVSIEAGLTGDTKTIIDFYPYAPEDLNDVLSENELY